MLVKIQCSGDFEKEIIEHREKEYPHLVKSAWEVYFLTLAREAIKKGKESEKA